MTPVLTALRAIAEPTRLRLLALLAEAALCIHERSTPREPRRELREGLRTKEAA